MKTIKISVFNAGVIASMLEYLIDNNLLEEHSKGAFHWHNLSSMALDEIKNEVEKIKEKGN